jgi:hypothetical protein
MLRGLFARGAMALACYQRSAQRSTQRSAQRQLERNPPNLRTGWHHHARDAARRRARAAPPRSPIPAQVARRDRARGAWSSPRTHDIVTRTSPSASRISSSTRWRSAARARPRSTPTWALRPVSSGTDEEVEKLQVGRALGRRHRHGPVDGRRPRRLPRGDHRTQHRADRHRADLLDDHRAKIEDLDRETVLETSSTRRSRAWTTSPSTRACASGICPSSRIA